MSILKFFREDLSEILGVYCDEDKIYLARLTDKLETAEINFEVDLNNKNSQIEQLAEKIKFACNQRGWKTSNIGVVLRDGAAVTLQTSFKNIPSNEIQNAVKIWATAHAKTNARYTSIPVGNEIWMEALPAFTADEYIAAFEKFFMKLCALTVLPPIPAKRKITPFTRAVFAAELLKHKKPPNLLTVQTSTWNLKKISLAAAVIFLIALTGFSVKLAGDYFFAENRAVTTLTRFNSKENIFAPKQHFDALKAPLNRFENLIFAQELNPQKYNALVKIGKLSDGKISILKLKTSNETFELEGAADSADAVKLYLSRLKNYLSPKVKIKNSAETDAQFIFTISVDFQDNRQ